MPPPHRTVRKILAFKGGTTPPQDPAPSLIQPPAARRVVPRPEAPKKRRVETDRTQRDNLLDDRQEAIRSSGSQLIVTGLVFIVIATVGSFLLYRYGDAFAQNFALRFGLLPGF